MPGFGFEVELLTGAYRAALPDGTGAEWPPHPERLFSALVQAWGDGVQPEAERAALEWLERAGAPRVHADVEVYERTSPIVYVPPNDRAFPQRQARTFAVVTPSSAHFLMAWDSIPPPEVAQALGELASRVASVGHSASLVRMAFVSEPPEEPNRTWKPNEDGVSALRVAYPGRLSHLQQWIARDERPRTLATLRYSAPSSFEAHAASSDFGGPEDWIIFEDIESAGHPDVLAFAHVSQRVRDALMSLSDQQPPPEVISGHGSSGEPSRTSHLACVPLMDVGWEHSNGALLGFALVMPRTLPGPQRSVVVSAVASFAPFHEGGEPIATVQLRREQRWRVQRSALPSRASLRPGRWCATANVWGSVTPVLLDRFPDKDDPVEIAQTIALSCKNIGLSDLVEIELHKYSPVNGAPDAYPARGNASRPDWSFPAGSSLAARPRRHVVLRFASPVRGPVLIGAGRYRGFGLCLPLRTST